MLRDEPIRKKGNDLARQWTSDDYFDLIVWYNPDGVIYGFQLCYDKLGDERAVTWIAEKGFRHTKIDGGEDDVTTLKKTPILGGSIPFQAEPVTEEFKRRSSNLRQDIRELVLTKLLELSNSAGGY